MGIAQKHLTERREDAKKAEHALNIVFIVATVLAMFWRVFLLGETLIDVAVLNNQLPWGYYAGQSSDYPYNRLDPTDMYVTRDYFVVQAYRDGEMPLWNPYTMAGHPIYADGVTRTLSPSLLFYTFLDIPLGYSVARVVELTAAAVFMYLFLVGVGASPRGALAGSLVFAFSAHSMFHLTGLGWWGGLMWLPLIMLFVHRAAWRKSFTQAVLAGLTLAAQFYSAYMPNQIYYVGAIVFGYLFWGIYSSADSGPASFKRRAGLTLAWTAVTLAVGLALSATQWVPQLELLRHSNRYIVPSQISYIYLPPWYAATLVFPNLFGTSYDVNTLTLFTAINVSHDHILYLGIAALLPIGFSVYFLWRAPKGPGPRRQVTFFALLALVALVAMMAAPLYVYLTRYIPVLQTIRVIVRAGVLYLFAASGLVAFGTDLLLAAEGGALARFYQYARRFLFITVGFAIVCTIAAYAVKLAKLSEEPAGRGAAAFARRAAALLSRQFTPPDSGVIIPIAFLVSAVLLVRWLSLGRISRRGFFVGLVALLVVDLFWYSTHLNPTYDRARVFHRTEITDLLKSLPPGRVLVTPSDLLSNRKTSVDPGARKIIAPPNTLLAYQISTVTGKDQLFPRWYREYCALIEPQPYLSHVVFDENRSRYFDLLNVRYVLTHASQPAPADYRLLRSAEGVSVYENPSALPRAFFVRRVIWSPTHADALSLIGDAAFDPATTAVIETPIQNAETVKGTAVIRTDRRNYVEIETDNPSDGLLVLSDNYYPGWRAYVDGAEAEILRANYTMRAVRVPAGRHAVSFVFEPPLVRLSIYLSLAAAAMVAVSLSILRRREKGARGQ